MASRSLWRTHWPALALVVVFAVVLIGAQQLPSTEPLKDVLDLVSTVLALTVAFLQYMNQRVDRWRLGVNRLRLSATNRQVTLRVNAEFTSDRSGRDFADITGLFQRQPKDSTRLLQTGPRSETWIWKDSTVRVDRFTTTGVSGDDDDIVRLTFPALARPYRETQRLLDADIFPLMQRLEREIAPSAKKYVVRVQFSGDNPYLGLFVNKLHAEQISTMELVITEPSKISDANDVVRVRKNYIEIITEDAYSAERLSKHYLALQPAKGS